MRGLIALKLAGACLAGACLVIGSVAFTAPAGAASSTTNGGTTAQAGDAAAPAARAVHRRGARAVRDHRTPTSRNIMKTRHDTAKNAISNVR